jgi:hypothetical protein
MTQRKFERVVGEMTAAGDGDALLYLDGVIRGAWARFKKIKPCGVNRPAPADVDAFLARVVAEGRERGGELIW